MTVNAIRTLAVILLLCLGQTASSSTSGSIPWGDDIAFAFQQSALSGKPILLHFYSNNCPPCKMLDTRAFKDEKVITALSNQTIPLKINVDKNRSLADRYEVTRWPTDVYLHPNGDEIGRSVSPQDPQKYCELVSRVNSVNHLWIAERIASQNSLPNKHVLATAANEAPRVDELNAGNNSVAGSIGMNIAAAMGSGQAEPRARPGNKDLTSRGVVTKSATFATDADVNSVRMETNPYCAAASVGPNGQASTQCSAGIDNIPNSTVQISNAAQLISKDRGSEFQAGSHLVGFAKDSPPNRYTQATARLGGVMSEDNTPAMDGFCAVTLRTQGAWMVGNPSFAIKHRGRIYCCSSEENRQLFLEQPDYYSPVLSGYDIVHFCETGKLESGRREFGCEGNGHIFLFKDAQTYEIFQAQAIHYLQQISAPASNERVANALEAEAIRR